MKSFEINALGLEGLNNAELQVNGGTFDPIDWIMSKVLDKIIDLYKSGFTDGTFADWYSTMYQNNPLYHPFL